MATDLQALAQQFSDRKLADLILHHVNNLDMEISTAALAGLLDELRVELRKPVTDLIDFLCGMPQAQMKKLFSGNCGEKMFELINISKGFLYNNHNLQITEDEAFAIFNIIVVNYAVSCHSHPQSKQAMRKAAGVTLFRRLFGS